MLLTVVSCSGTDDFLESPTPNQTLLSITASGVGPINAKVPFSKEAIAAVLSGYEVRSIQSAVEDHTAWVFAAFSDGKQVVQVFRGTAGKVGEIHGVTQYLLGPAGERIGMTFEQVGPHLDTCRVGRSLWRGMAICPSRGAANVELVFAIAKYEGPYDRLAPAEILNQATLQRIIWKPAAGKTG